MKSHRVDAIANYRSPDSAHWAHVNPTRIELMPTPLELQPSGYVRNAWAHRRFGETPDLQAASVHDGSTWAVRVQWTAGPVAPDAEFPDAVAVALPMSRDSVLMLMGSKEAPIHMLRWDAGNPGARSVIAMGFGSSAPGPEVKQHAQAVSNGPIRQVVLTRSLGEGKNIASLKAASRTGIGFAVWRGANEERAGIKAYSINWTELALDA